MDDLLIQIKKYLKDMFPYLSAKISNYNKERYYKYLINLKRIEYPNELKKIYKKRTGLELDWDNLRTYNEKIQWAKLYDTDPKKTVLSDKFLVREWVKNIIGEQYLIPLLGVWDSFDEINFDNLPDKFVLKTNNSSGTNLIVKDKSKLNRIKAKALFNNWMKTNFAFVNGFEMQYADIKAKIVAEQYLDNEGNDLYDYKFMCFNGKVNFCWVDINRFEDHRRNVYDLDWNLQNWQIGFKNTGYAVANPDNFNRMIEIAETLCQDFSHVRVDLYNIKGKIYFGEMTFTQGAGFTKFYPKEYDLIIGEMWSLPINTNYINK